MTASTYPTLVMKFGGTSVGTPEAMHQTAKIVRDNLSAWPRIVVVTSALSGVTDLLIKSAIAATRGDVFTFQDTARILSERHEAILTSGIIHPARQDAIRESVQALIQDFSNLCLAISVLGEATPRAMDAVASLGERMAVRLLAGVIDSLGAPAEYVEATRLIVTDDHHQAAHPDMAATKAAIHASCPPFSSAALSRWSPASSAPPPKASPPPWAAAAAITPPPSSAPCSPPMKSGSGPTWTA